RLCSDHPEALLPLCGVRRLREPRALLALVMLVGASQGLTPSWGAMMDGAADDVAGASVPGDPAAAPGFEGREDASGSAPDYLERYSRPFRVDTGELAFTEKYYWHRLTHPTTSDKRVGGAVLAVAFALWSHKEQIQSDWAQRDTTLEHETTLKRIQKLGGGIVVPATALLMYVGGSTMRDYRSKETGVMLAHSLLLTDLAT